MNQHSSLIKVYGRQLDVVVRQSTERLFRHQAQDGRFSFFCEVSPWANAMAIIVLYLCGYKRDPLIGELQRSILGQQQPNGGWCLYADQKFHLSSSVLSYFALLLTGHSRESLYMKSAELMILEYGGLTKASSLSKAFLAVAGQVPWSAIPDTHIELILERPQDVLSVYDFSVPMRVHLPSLMILSHLHYKVHVPERCSVRHLIVPGESFPNERLPARNDAALRACQQFLFDRLESDGTIAGYLSATSFFIFACLALGYGVTDAPVQKALSGIRALIYPRQKSIQQQMFTSDIWDTALALQALSTAGVDPLDHRMVRAAIYLVSRQHRGVSDWVYHAPSARPGGWAFSHSNVHYPDLDDTAAVLLALYPYRKRGIFRLPWVTGIKWVQHMQNRDGGWGAFEKDVDKLLLELISGADLPGVVTDPSAPDVTGRVLAALACSGLASKAVGKRGMDWLLRMQREDGSWYGRWGVSYIYGTYHAVKGLRAGGADFGHPSIVRARKWLERVQNQDGGYGESCESDTQGRLIPLGHSLPSQTAWGLLGLLAASEEISPAMERTARWLVSSYARHGWREKYPTGAGVAGEAYIRYHSYPRIWPLMALAEYRKRLIRDFHYSIEPSAR